MKQISIIRFLSIAMLSVISLNIGCKAKKIAGAHQLSLTISSTNEYCGGAAPSEEMLKEMSTPKVLPNATVYFVKRNDEGVNTEEFAFTTDGKGRISLQLMPGHYYVYNMSQKQLNESVVNMTPEIKECTLAFLHQSAFDFPVFEDIDSKIIFHIRCNPCLPPAP